MLLGGMNCWAASPDPVLLTSHETGTIIDVNPAFVRQSDLRREAVLGKKMGEGTLVRVEPPKE